MRRLALVAALMGACTALAQEESASMIYSNGRLTVQLLAAECAAPGMATALLEKGAVTPPKAASIKRGRTMLRGCWALDSDTDVVIRDEEGDSGFLPVDAFRPASHVEPPLCTSCA